MNKPQNPNQNQNQERVGKRRRKSMSPARYCIPYDPIHCNENESVSMRKLHCIKEQVKWTPGTKQSYSMIDMLSDNEIEVILHNINMEYQRRTKKGVNVNVVPRKQDRMGKNLSQRRNPNPNPIHNENQKKRKKNNRYRL